MELVVIKIKFFLVAGNFQDLNYLFNMKCKRYE